MKKFFLFLLLLFIAQYSFPEKIVIVLDSSWQKYPFYKRVWQQFSEKYIENSIKIVYNRDMGKDIYKKYFIDNEKSNMFIVYTSLIENEIKKEKESRIPFLFSKGKVVIKHSGNVLIYDKGKIKRKEFSFSDNVDKYFFLGNDSYISQEKKIKLFRKNITAFANELVFFFKKEVGYDG